MTASIARRATAEFVGTGFLVSTVIGSGIMAERLAGGNLALALLGNTLATGAILVALIFTFGGISGAHFNPAVTVADALERGMPWREVPAYVVAQCFGGVVGAVVAHLMFGLPLLFASHHARSGGAQVFSEFVATFGLLAVIWGCSRVRANSVPFAVGAYITAAYWFTASTSFANPAVTIARGFSDTFAGIRPADVPLFIAAQMSGAIAATFLSRWLIPSLPETAEDILLPHESKNTHESKNSDESKNLDGSNSDKSRNSGQPGSPVRTYLFACVHNAGRSQMAAALFNLYADGRGCRGISAGTEPGRQVHPEVVAVMREIGIDLSSAKPQRLTEDLAKSASVLVTMGCGEACPFVPGLRIVDWALPDPRGQRLEVVRAIRDEIHDRVKELIGRECGECCQVGDAD